MKKILLFVFAYFPFHAYSQNELVDFESSPQFVMIDSLTGCWQIGTPSKSLFDTAYSPTRALMTDTLNNYPNDSISYAYFTFPTSAFETGYSLTFKHRYDAELGVDGAYIEIYDCNSSSWTNLWSNPGSFCYAYGIGYNQNPPAINLPVVGMTYSGITSGWAETVITFNCQLVFQGSESRGGFTDPQLRFAFMSDGNSTNGEGWMIDDILWESYGGICSGIEEYENSLGLKAHPSITNGNISFETESNLISKITIYDFSGKLIENFTFNQTNFQTLELSNLSNGMYFYSVEDGKAVGKFMIEK